MGIPIIIREWRTNQIINNLGLILKALSSDALKNKKTKKSIFLMPDKGGSPIFGCPNSTEKASSQAHPRMVY